MNSLNISSFVSSLCKLCFKPKYDAMKLVAPGGKKIVGSNVKYSQLVVDRRRTHKLTSMVHYMSFMSDAGTLSYSVTDAHDQTFSANQVHPTGP